MSNLLQRKACLALISLGSFLSFSAISTMPAMAKASHGGGAHGSQTASAAKPAAPSSSNANAQRARALSHAHGHGGRYLGYNDGEDGYTQPNNQSFSTQTFSGPAYIGPKQYNHFVQSYRWPNHPASSQAKEAAPVSGEAENSDQQSAADNL